MDIKRLIARGDLLATLDRAVVAGKVTIISAPAGSGKTSLLHAWADRPGQPRRLARVQVQRGQHDAQQFWLALLSAVRDASGASSGAMGDLAQGRLNEAAAHLAVAEPHAGTAPPDRRHRLQAAVASLQLSLARRRGDLAGVIEQARFLASPVSGPSDGDIVLGSDLRAVALMNLGTAEAWTLGQADAPDAERHLQEGTDLAREIGRPYLQVGCLAQLGFASLVLHSFATTQARCREAIALAERYDWGTEPVIAPALIMLAATLVWTGEFDEGEQWLQRTRQALQTDSGPDVRLLLHRTAGILHAGRGRHREALEELAAAEDLASQLAGSRALATRTTRWLVATQARAGMTGQARATLAALDDQQAGSGEIRNARAVICLADRDPAGALAAVAGVLDGTAPVLGSTVQEAYLLAGLAHRELGDQRAASQAAEQALALAEADRLILPFAMTGSARLLEGLPRHQTAHAALLADILDVLHGASPPPGPAPPPAGEELSPGELRVLRYLPTNLSRPEIAGQLSVSPNTVNAHIRSIYAKLGVNDRSAAVRRARELRLLAAGRAR
jgi:LuxR family transcriptional regulator, maltose regulon positive regulatory protein